MCALKKSSSNALGPTLGFMQNLEHLKFLEYFLGVETKRGRNANCRIAFFFISYEYKNKCVNSWNQVLIMHCFRGHYLYSLVKH